MYVNGIDPGFSGDMLPFAALSLSQSATSVVVQETLTTAATTMPNSPA